MSSVPKRTALVYGRFSASNDVSCSVARLASVSMISVMQRSPWNPKAMR
ncbi:MAG: hypothetical protein FWH33_09975 [Oscillospiraceae bacterium]|nr:hypothetical protein [Oscillospiraceae bacterium]